MDVIAQSSKIGAGILNRSAEGCRRRTPRTRSTLFSNLDAFGKQPQLESYCSLSQAKVSAWTALPLSARERLPASLCCSWTFTSFLNLLQSSKTGLKPQTGPKQETGAETRQKPAADPSHGQRAASWSRCSEYEGPIIPPRVRRLRS